MNYSFNFSIFFNREFCNLIIKNENVVVFLNLKRENIVKFTSIIYNCKCFFYAKNQTFFMREIFIFRIINRENNQFDRFKI
jgi:hypothetical protein